MGWIGSAENLPYMKFIETHARAFLALIILVIDTVSSLRFQTNSDLQIYIGHTPD